MQRSLEIEPVDGKLDAFIRPPGSKSITNRALVCATFARGRVSKLKDALDSDDTNVMIDALRKIGIVIGKSRKRPDMAVFGLDADSGKTDDARYQISTSGETIDLFVGNSGTTIRFLTAALAMVGGDYRLSGVERMHERPIGDLVNALQQLGANVETESPNGCPPVRIQSPPAVGGQTTVRGDVSSQFLSGLMMAAPLAEGAVEIVVDGELISKPYVDLTIEVMKSFGVECQVNSAFDRFVIQAEQEYRVCDYWIEPDATAASYFWAAAAICGGSVKVTGLNETSIQGDVAFAKCLAGMGCDVVFEDDGISIAGPATKSLDLFMSDISDTVQTMAAVALFLPTATTIRGVKHNRLKETDRIGNLAIELRKLGAKVEELEDGLVIHPGKLRSAKIETYNDHRMAMSFALVGLRQPGIVILNPDCVSKTYPRFFADLQSLRPNQAMR